MINIPGQYFYVRLGIVFAHAALLYVVGFHEMGSIAALTVYPLFYGGAVQFVLDPKRGWPAHRVFMWGMVPVGVLIVGLLIAKIETFICIVILALPFIVLMLTGLWIVRWMLGYISDRRSLNRLHASLWFVPVLAIPVLNVVPFPHQDIKAVTEIVIDAPVEVVWKRTVEIPEIQKSERIWTFSHNVLRVPRPFDAVVHGKVRQLRWTEGVRFQEHITQARENQLLAWDFVFNEPETLLKLDPHISPNGKLLQLKRGFYSLIPLEGGRTRLRLESHYSLRTPMNFYLKVWGEVLLQDLHGSVLAVIKRRSEGRG